ncbi:Ribonuclease HII [Phytophthora citrophthora]|uniref:Ribonuclease n=1 Tax=Phytophthora citrophthora TaxID=4793 RepID=A0AAD9G1Z4_9STRA|nr:Ribonuclease HII [Phytophthora citrophthora]
MRKTIKRSVKVASATAPRRSPRLNKALEQSESVTDLPVVPARVKRVSKPKKQHKNGGEKPKSTLSRTFETRYEGKGYTTVIGVDEAGRGPLAGPVVAAACHVPLDVTVEGVDDSKKILEPQREKLYELLTSHPRITYAVHVNSAQRIDEINILQASLESMTKSVNEVAEKLSQKVKTFVLVDGNKLPPTLELPAEAVVKGDSKVYSIAAASIIAKVTRDRLMREYDEKFPLYGLAQHKGYPTKAHIAAIAKHGPCEIHRMTFAPLKPKEEPKPKAKGRATKKKTT